MSSDSPIKISTTADTAEDVSIDKVTCRLCVVLYLLVVYYLTQMRAQADVEDSLRNTLAPNATFHTALSPVSDLRWVGPSKYSNDNGFYKKEIETDIYSGPSKTAQERQQMMELLKKFEEEVSSQKSLPGGDEDDEDEDDTSDLVNRFQSVDLESASSEALWAMLTPAEQSKFMKAFDDPTSELAQQLLASEQLDKEIEEPWWKAPSVVAVEDEEKGEEICQNLDRRTGHQYGNRPTFMEIPTSMVKPFPVGHPLIYNMCAICISYAYITRHLGTSPLSNLKPENGDHHEALHLLTQTVPFLTDRRSTKVYSDLSEVVTDIWSTFELGVMVGDLFALLLRDSACLLKPLRVTQVAPASASMPALEMVPSTHPHGMTVLVLSDLNGVFSATIEQTPQDKSARLKSNHIRHKLLFYAAHILSTPSVILDAVADEMRAQAVGYSSSEEMGSWEGTRVGEGVGGFRTRLVQEI